MVTSLINIKVEFVLSMSLEAKHDICTYLVLNSVNKMYWDDPCLKNEISAYMVVNLINGKVEFVPWFKTWLMNLFGFVFGKMKLLEWPQSLKLDFSIFGYKFDIQEVCTCPSMSFYAKKWYLNLIALKFGNLNIWVFPCIILCV